MANIIVSGLDVSISDIVTLIYRSSLNDINNNQTIVEQTSTSKIVSLADGTRYILSGENLTYFSAGDVFELRDVEGMVSSGTITGFRAISPSGETLIDYSGVSFPA